jgi:hypothetical protein
LLSWSRNPRRCVETRRFTRSLTPGPGSHRASPQFPAELHAAERPLPVSLSLQANPGLYPEAGSVVFRRHFRLLSYRTMTAAGSCETREEQFFTCWGDRAGWRWGNGRFSARTSVRTSLTFLWFSPVPPGIGRGSTSGHESFFPRPFRFIARQRPYHSTICTLQYRQRC